MAFLLIGLANAEMSLWKTQLMNGLSNGTSFNPNYNSTVQDHIFFQFDDTSLQDVGRNKPIPMTIEYQIFSLPYSLTGFGGEVDWCSLITRHFKNIYDSDNNRINTTIEYQNLNFSTNASVDRGFLYFEMRSDDTISGDVYCHYTNVSTLYLDNILVGRFSTTFLPSFECEGCSQYSLEELSNEVERSDEIFSEQTQMYNTIQRIVVMNFKVWLILKWLIAIAFLFVCVGLIFYSVYYYYQFIKKLESET